jgi:hypothetical protein
MSEHESTECTIESVVDIPGAFMRDFSEEGGSYKAMTSHKAAVVRLPSGDRILCGDNYTVVLPDQPSMRALDPQAATLQARVRHLEAALVRLRDCDFVITPADRMDAVRDIAREALRG